MGHRFHRTTRPHQGIRYVARGEVATVLTGGVCPTLEGDFQNGFFFQPTIFSEVKNQMRVAQEEIFGPVTSVITFKNEDELIKEANDTIYGLSAGIWTRDIVRAHRFAKEIHAGTVWINTFNMFNAASPFGGFKQSGYGREMGKHALELYTHIKSVWVDLSGKPIGWYGNKKQWAVGSGQGQQEQATSSVEL